MEVEAKMKSAAAAAIERILAANVHSRLAQKQSALVGHAEAAAIAVMAGLEPDRTFCLLAR